VTTFSYDFRNRLVKVASPGKVVSYQYDAFDRRIRKLVDEGGNGSIDSKTAWVWDGNQVLFQFKDPDGDGGNEFRLTNRYLYSDIVDLILADEQVGVPGTGVSGGGLVSVQIGSTGSASTEGLYRILWPLSDQLGTVRDLIDSNGTRLEHRVYDSFGKLLQEREDFGGSTGGGGVGSPGGGGGVTTDAIDSLFAYAGREWDKDVKLQFNRARWYDPATGRWLSQDPIGFAGGDANLYRYVFNQPTRYTDPSGEIVPLIVIGGLAGANIFIWGNNAQVADDLVNDRRIDLDQTPYSLRYHKGLVCSTAKGSAIAVATPYVATALPAAATTSLAIGIGGYGVYSSGGQAIEDFSEGNYFSGSFNTGMAGLSGLGVGQVIKPGLGISPQGTPMQEFQRFRLQGYSPREARLLMEPYNGMGNHFIPRRGGWPIRMKESPYNIMKPQGINKGRFYERHAMGDSNWNGCKIRDGLAPWTRFQFRPQPAGNLEYLNSPFYGMSDELQAVTTILILPGVGSPK
jgi:RHS repeat-associated protein